MKKYLLLLLISFPLVVFSQDRIVTGKGRIIEIERKKTLSEIFTDIFDCPFKHIFGKRNHDFSWNGPWSRYLKVPYRHRNTYSYSIPDAIKIITPSGIEIELGSEPTINIPGVGIQRLKNSIIIHKNRRVRI